MSDLQEAKRIQTFTVLQLLEYVMTNPEYLTDSYYSVLGTAIRTRYKDLTL